MRWGVVDSFSERLSVLTNVYPWYDLEVVIKVKDRDHEISVMRFSKFYVLEEDVVDIGMGVDSALGTLGGGDGSMDQLP